MVCQIEEAQLRIVFFSHVWFFICSQHFGSWPSSFVNSIREPFIFGCIFIGCIRIMLGMLVPIDTGFVSRFLRNGEH